MFKVFCKILGLFMVYMFFSYEWNLYYFIEDTTQTMLLAWFVDTVRLS